LSGDFQNTGLLPAFAKLVVKYRPSDNHGRRQRGCQWCPDPPFKLCASDWSLETWSRSRDAFLRVSVSKVSGLETLNIAKKWFGKIFIIQQFLFVVFAGKK